MEDSLCHKVSLIKNSVNDIFMKSSCYLLFFLTILSFGLNGQKSVNKKFIDFAQGFESFYYVEKDSLLYVVGTKLTGNGKLTDNKVYHRINNIKWKKVLSVPNEGFGYTVALDNKNKLWGWGNNQLGILSDTLNKLILKPVLLNNYDWVDFDISSSGIVALKKDKSLWTWGNFWSISNLQPTKLFESIKEFSIGNGVLFVIKEDKSLWSIGSFYIQEKGEINYIGTGNGKVESFEKPTQVGNDLDWSKISCKSHILAIKSNGNVYSWGSNQFGQLGISGKEYGFNSENEIYFLNKPSSNLELRNRNNSKAIYDSNGNLVYKAKSVFAFFYDSYILDFQNNLYHCREQFLGNDWGPNQNEFKWTVSSRPQFLGRNFCKNWIKIISNEYYKGIGLTKTGDLYYWKDIGDKEWSVPFATRLRDSEQYYYSSR